jgi:tetratricopeptide (TPR) repeat protein
MSRALIAVCFALLPAVVSAAGAEVRELTAEQYRQGLEMLRGRLEKRGEDAASAERFVDDMESAFRGSDGRVLVTRAVFAAFLDYEAAWVRKTRDSKNERVTPAQLQHEIERAAQLKEQFRKEASQSSPRFYRVFQAAVQDVRTRPLNDGKGYAGNSAVFFGDQVDDSYSHVDAGDEALENGDTAGAVAEANLALADNPGNADAYVLRSGAEYERQDAAAAVKDAQTALQMDPGNLQAQAIVSLSGPAPLAAQAALSNAVAAGASLADDGRQAPLPAAAVPGGAALTPAASPAPNPSRYGMPSPTPVLGTLLSTDLTARAAQTASADARSSIAQLDQALTLNPRNAVARSWRSAVANRIGDYASALDSAEQSLAGDPNDAGAYFNKAYALAGAGDKAGMLDALSGAARIDPSYKPLLEQALQVPQLADMELLFSGWSTAHALPIPRPRHRSFPLSLLLLAGIGGVLAVAGAAQLLRKSR